jgi:flavin reductase (DIM6/NTAB) family NADH-FMN oxidoreductase RutF
MMTVLDTISDVIKDQLGPAIGCLASGVYIVTAEHDDVRGGMIASWLMQAGFAPPALTVAMAPDRHVGELIQKSGRFTVNVLGEGQFALMKPFGKGTDDPFSQLETTETQCGLRLNDAIAHLDCVLIDRLSGATDHDVLLAEIVDAAKYQAKLKPMTHVRKTGFQY